MVGCGGVRKAPLTDRSIGEAQALRKAPLTDRSFREAQALRKAPLADRSWSGGLRVE